MPRYRYRGHLIQVGPLPRGRGPLASTAQGNRPVLEGTRRYLKVLASITIGSSSFTLAAYGMVILGKWAPPRREGSHLKVL